MSGVLTRLARAPALHVVLLGGVLFAAGRLLGPAMPRSDRDDPGRVITVTRADRERLRREWAAEHGAPPGPAEERTLVDDAVEDEVLYREALRLRLDRDDPVVRGRLVDLARYLDDGPIEDEAALEREARMLGLARADVVLRRHLVQSVRLLAAGPQEAALPTKTALEAYLATHADAFAQPPRVRFVHVYLNAQRRGASLERDARRLAARLRAGGVTLADAPALGDPFPRGAAVSMATASDVDRRFGAGFTEAVAHAPLDAWTGPLRSAYGVHMVWVQERMPSGVPALAQVRGQVVHRWLRERRTERMRAVVAALRARYDVRVEDG